MNWQNKIKDLARWSAVAMAFCLPFSTAAINLLFGLMVLFWLLSGDVFVDLKRIFSRREIWILSGFIVWVFLSLVWTQVDMSIALEGLKKFRKFILFGVCAALFWGEEKWRQRVLGALFLGLLLLAITCLGVWMNVPFLPPSTPGQGAILFKNHITQGFLLSVLLVLSFYYFLKKKSWFLRILFVVSGALAVIVSFYLANGRTGYVCIISGVLACAWFASNEWKSKLVVLLISVICIGVVCATSERFIARTQQVGTDVVLLEKGKRNTSSGLRISFWQASVAMVKDHPILGVGLGSWGKSYCELFKCGGNKIKLMNPHSDFMNIVSQFGFVGLFLWLAFLVACCLAANRALTREDKLLFFGFFFAFMSGSVVNSFVWDVTEGFTFSLIVPLLLVCGGCFYENRKLCNVKAFR